jgi:hypothetical protein
MDKNRIAQLAEAVSDLTRALIFSEIPHHVINLLAKSLYYYDSNPDGATRLIADMQREAYKRTQAPKLKQLSEYFHNQRSLEKKRRKRTDKRR